MLNGNCSKGPGCRVTVSVATLPALAKSDSECLLKYLKKNSSFGDISKFSWFFVTYLITSSLGLSVNSTPHCPLSRLAI